MAQYGRPASDITANWTPSIGTTHWQCIDETPYSDTDYVSTTTNGRIFQVSLSPLVDPISSTGHIIRIRAYASGSSSAEKITYALYEGTTVRATSPATSITRNSFNTYTLTLSAAQANAITNYANLSIKCTASMTTGETLRVSWVEFEVPNAISNSYVSLSINEASISTLQILTALKRGLSVTEIITTGLGRLLAGKKSTTTTATTIPATNRFLAVKRNLSFNESATTSITRIANFHISLSSNSIWQMAINAILSGGNIIYNEIVSSVSNCIAITISTASRFRQAISYASINVSIPNKSSYFRSLIQNMVTDTSFNRIASFKNNVVSSILYTPLSYRMLSYLVSANLIRILLPVIVRVKTRFVNVILTNIYLPLLLGIQTLYRSSTSIILAISTITLSKRYDILLSLIQQNMVSITNMVVYIAVIMSSINLSSNVNRVYSSFKTILAQSPTISNIVIITNHFRNILSSLQSSITISKVSKYFLSIISISHSISLITNISIFFANISVILISSFNINRILIITHVVSSSETISPIISKISTFFRSILSIAIIIPMSPQNLSKVVSSIIALVPLLSRKLMLNRFLLYAQNLLPEILNIKNIFRIIGISTIYNTSVIKTNILSGIIITTINTVDITRVLTINRIVAAKKYVITTMKKSASLFRSVTLIVANIPYAIHGFQYTIITFASSLSSPIVSSISAKFRSVSHSEILVPSISRVLSFFNMVSSSINLCPGINRALYYCKSIQYSLHIIPMAIKKAYYNIDITNIFSPNSFLSIPHKIVSSIVFSSLITHPTIHLRNILYTSVHIVSIKRYIGLHIAAISSCLTNIILTAYKLIHWIKIEGAQSYLVYWSQTALGLFVNIAKVIGKTEVYIPYLYGRIKILPYFGSLDQNVLTRSPKKKSSGEIVRVIPAKSSGKIIRTTQQNKKKASSGGLTRK